MGRGSLGTHCKERDRAGGLPGPDNGIFGIPLGGASIGCIRQGAPVSIIFPLRPVTMTVKRRRASAKASDFRAEVTEKGRPSSLAPVRRYIQREREARCATRGDERGLLEEREAWEESAEGSFIYLRRGEFISLQLTRFNRISVCFNRWPFSDQLYINTRVQSFLVYNLSICNSVL